MTLGLCAAPDYDTMPVQQLDLWIEFRALEDKLEREEQQRAERAQQRR